MLAFSYQAVCDGPYQGMQCFLFALSLHFLACFACCFPTCQDFGGGYLVEPAHPSAPVRGSPDYLICHSHSESWEAA